MLMIRLRGSTRGGVEGCGGGGRGVGQLGWPSKLVPNPKLLHGKLQKVSTSCIDLRSCLYPFSLRC